MSNIRSLEDTQVWKERELDKAAEEHFDAYEALEKAVAMMEAANKRLEKAIKSLENVK